MSAEILADRTVLEIRGEDARGFLQGLITNDVRRVSPTAAIYAALLTPQGKVVCDFFLYEEKSSLLLDCSRSVAADLQKRLFRYRLRARVEILSRNGWNVVVGSDLSRPDEPMWQDPRHCALGWRSIRQGELVEQPLSGAYLERRLELGIPEGDDLGCERVFALDADLEELNAVSFDKGCYVGQELTARMKHRGTARKKLVPVAALESRIPPRDTPLTASEREIGTIAATYGTRGFALVRLDRLTEADAQPLIADGVPVRVIKPEWLFA